ncbi:TPA: flagellin FliC [Pluralibacter gergoviae]|uniref:Flagellin n=1 Tax=Pluralibacter gergoviae TaxID=61647 RepID=A0A0J5L8F5_PLUGE|nr:flagellin [Pluralibacter gergoviae]KMK15971.1 flagellin [Pluralibacter gergoviae]KMK27204.1 flagellin [Pluralibacter gergoviae]MBL3695204.1 flagellin FliC [Pluralibacter gergoviae]HDS1154014.1 flagellin FliC [Pluralibacter gergoviae]
MAQVINTNSLSLITQNNINKNQSALATSIERLSSGLRINSAKDDAAGQAIANRFTSNIKGLTQAARNANDGISLAQTTEGALSEINNNLQRVRELTVQASTGTNSDSDLSSIQDEIKSRLSEIDRVSGQTQFNGVDVLSKNGTMSIQVGANDGQKININLQQIDSKTLGLDGFNVRNNDAVTTSAAITNLDVPATVSVKASTSDLADVATSINKGGTVDKIVKGDDDKYYASLSGATDANDNGYYEVTINSDSSSANAGKITLVSATKASPAVTDTTAVTTVSNTATAGKAVTFDTDAATAKISTGASLVKLQDAKGNDTNTYAIKAQDGTLYAANVDASTGKVSLKTENYTDASGKSVTNAAVKFGGDDGKTEVVVDADSGKSYKAAELAGQDLSSATNTVEAIADGKTTDPLKALDAAIASVDKFRSSLGAVQNQLTSAVTNLNNTTTNLSEAQSRIQDADYATEVSNMSKAQIIQQAGNSVLSKANQVPQQILSLLQG